MIRSDDSQMHVKSSSLDAGENKKSEARNLEHGAERNSTKRTKRRFSARKFIWENVTYP